MSITREIRGAALAPIVTRTPDGVRAATADEVSSLTFRRRMWGWNSYWSTDYGSSRPSGDPSVTWRLSLQDPQDRRSIYFLAALAHGASDDQAETAALVKIGARLYQLVWHGWKTGRPLVQVRGDDVAHATGSLCVATWGARAQRSHSGEATR